MTIEQYLEKYDKYIRGLICRRADSDYCDDAYQEVVMQIIKYKDKLDSLDSDSARCAYICQITKHTVFPKKRSDKKLKTYGDFTSSDDDDATDPEEWLLEDNTYAPDNKVDLAKRAWAEEIIEKNEQLKQIEKLCRKIRYRFDNKLNVDFYKATHKERYKECLRNYYYANRDKCIKNSVDYRRRMRQDPEWHAKELEYKRKYRETHREQLRARGQLYKQRKKEQRNEQFGNIK